MPNPKRRHSNMRTRLRRSHDALAVPTQNWCKQCGAPVLSHRVCSKCGYYRGRQVVTVKTRESKEKA